MTKNHSKTQKSFQSSESQKWRNPDISRRSQSKPENQWLQKKQKFVVKNRSPRSLSNRRSFRSSWGWAWSKMMSRIFTGLTKNSRRKLRDITRFWFVKSATSDLQGKQVWWIICEFTPNKRSSTAASVGEGSPRVVTARDMRSSSPVRLSTPMPFHRNWSNPFLA